MAKYKAKDIANWFLAYNQSKIVDNGADEITNLKMQKLLYYAQGTYLALKDEKLFDEDLVAWTHGPVVKEIYYDFCQYKSGGIKCVQINNEIKPSDIDKETQGILSVSYTHLTLPTNREV
eukprot:TRINITY_DN4299_c0_g1_i16.p2 TRINITY_DN4299_c0_g1~~TRINITY_DN4299_c0_g1_i16.p2  ORF type:complete len:120 (+),score=6.22 TRINITY_DN4299_c0_g1_i16:161-520(+)